MSLTKVTYSMIDAAPANVLDFGAVGDGVTDDTAAIQAALDSAFKTIYIPPGEYLLSAPLQIKNQANSFGKTIYGNKAQTYLIGTPGMDTIIDILKGGDGALSLVLRDLRFSFSGAFTGWCIRALGTGTLIDSRVEGCWFSTGTLSAGSFYGKSVFSSFVNNVHELSKTFVRCTLASATSFVNNKIFNTYDEQFYFDGTSVSNGVIIDDVNVNEHNRGAFIKAVSVNNLIVSNIDYQAGTTLGDSGQYCQFADLNDCTAQFNNCRVISTEVAGYVTANKVDTAFKFLTSTVSAANIYATYVQYAFRHSGESYTVVSDSVVENSLWGVAIDASATGTCDVKNNKFNSLASRPLYIPAANSVTLTVDGNHVVDPCRAAATYCWYFYTNSYSIFTNNVTRVSDSNVTYWFDIDTATADGTLIDGNVFIGTPSFGNFVPAKVYKLGGTNMGLYSLYYSTSAPSVGTWKIGDRAFNSNPSVGQPKGWVCTVAGTPGTWVSEGNL